MLNSHTGDSLATAFIIATINIIPPVFFSCLKSAEYNFNARHAEICDYSSMCCPGLRRI